MNLERLVEVKVERLPKNFGRKCSFKSHHGENTEDAVWEGWIPGADQPLYFCQWHLDDMISKIDAQVEYY